MQGFWGKLKNQAAFFLAFDFFFLPAFLAAFGASAAGLLAGAAAGAAAGDVAGAAAGAAGTTGAVGAAVCATEANARVLRTLAAMSLYMELPIRVKQYEDTTIPKQFWMTSVNVKGVNFKLPCFLIGEIMPQCFLNGSKSQVIPRDL
jgi:hypothetical protein